MDGALRVQLGRRGRPADDVWVDTVAAQDRLQSTHRLLAGTDHHVVDSEHLWAASVRADADVQAVVGAPLVVDPGICPTGVPNG